jgi:hypothetical protein
MNRKQWIGTSIAGAAVLFGGGAVYEARTGAENDRDVLAAIGPVILAGALPPGAEALEAFVSGFDTAVAGLPPHVQAEVAQLLTILRNGILRVLATGVMRPWPEASPQEIADFLNRWRYSGITKLRAGYDALHQLSLAAWYGNPQSWERIGYPGPPVIA